MGGMNFLGDGKAMFQALLSPCPGYFNHPNWVEPGSQIREKVEVKRG
jgi:hypothetical protein